MDPFIVDLPIKVVIFHSYLNLPKGIPKWLWCIPPMTINPNFEPLLGSRLVYDLAH